MHHDMGPLIRQRMWLNQQLANHQGTSISLLYTASIASNKQHSKRTND